MLFFLNPIWDMMLRLESALEEEVLILCSYL